jgi:glycosyltransferase involved in cell wall biosynthesis
MILGIDASNIRIGGGVTHLIELLRAADPVSHGFTRVILWSGRSTLSQIDEHPWLEKVHIAELDLGFIQRAFWQRFKLSGLVRAGGCDVLLVPGGSYAGDFHPIVTMSRNLLPFEWRELRRFGWSWLTLKMVLLRWTQSKSYRRADGLIFLTSYAKDAVSKVIGTTSCKKVTIPHGIHDRFNNPPRDQLDLNQYSMDQPFQILYVSTVDVHKHQWHVAEAIAKLRREGVPVALSLVGPSYPPALSRLKATLGRLDPEGEFIRYMGAVPYTELNTIYAEADMFLFASSCENLPNILLEGMASGLPIACSNLGPMPELLGDAGVYFDPERPEDIANSVRRLIESSELRADKAKAAFVLVQQYSWKRCADETFDFLAAVTEAS